MCIYIYIYIHTCMCMCMCMCVYVCMYVYTYIYIYNAALTRSLLDTKGGVCCTSCRVNPATSFDIIYACE